MSLSLALLLDDYLFELIVDRMATFIDDDADAATSFNLTVVSHVNQKSIQLTW